MRKLFILFALVAFGATVNAAIITKSGAIAANETWTNNNQYILDDFVIVQPGVTLTIQQGTVIKGTKGNLDTSVNPPVLVDEPGALIVLRGGRLVANGNRFNPIVFTSAEPVGSRAAGDWGGIIIAGNAQTNEGNNAQLEAFSALASPIDIFYGADASGSFNNNDDSGVLRYVRIEYAGFDIIQDEELNSLTLAGVGRGTSINYVQCSFGLDDAFEFFGGNVDAKFLVAYATKDDDFDTDQGNFSRLQYGVSFKEPSIADISGSNGIESDNDRSNPTVTPATRTTFSNFNFFGARQTRFNAFDPNHEYGAHIRRGSRTSVFNSVFIGAPVAGIFLDGAETNDNANNSTPQRLELKSNTISVLEASDLHILSNDETALGETAASWVESAAQFNTCRTGNAASLGIRFPYDVNLIAKWKLQASSVLLGAADFTDIRVQSGFFRKSPNFRGAFGLPGGVSNWVNAWTNFDPQNEAYPAPPATAGIEATEVVSNIEILNSQDDVTVFINNDIASEVVVSAINPQTGETVFTMESNEKFEGPNSFDFKMPAAGIYVLKVISGKDVKEQLIAVSK